MRSGSALARLQQVTTVLLVVAGSSWLAWHWPESPIRAVTGLLLICAGYSIVLAFELVLLRLVSRSDAARQPTWGELARAWWAETLADAVVFAWRQPFRWNAVPDQLPAARVQPARRGAVFIHGFVCNRGFWTPWLKELRRLDSPFIAVNLEPVFGSIDAYVTIIEDAVQRITRCTGLPPVLVCHSMGGLAARAWLRAVGDQDRVAHVITIGSPHHGTWLGRFIHVASGRQMQLGSQWLQRLHADAGAGMHARFTCWYSNCDNVVFPVSSATLAGADNRLVRGPAHVELAFHPQVMAESLAKIRDAAAAPA